MVSYRSLLDFTVHLEKNASIVEKMTLICAEESKNQSLETFGKHQPCLAKLDQKWYRAEILSIQYDTATVHFVDCGEERNVKLKDLKQLTLDASSLPRLALRCKIKNCPRETLSKALF